jgi:hypothetical protein
MNPLPFILLAISLPLLLGGCGKKEETVAETKPVDEAPINSIKYKITGDEVTITSCDKKASGTLTIPATIEGKTVTSIGNNAFWFCTSLTNITIGDSVTSIGKDAFGYCGLLTSITIPDSVTSIGAKAFFHCYSLTSIIIPDSVTSIGNEAFRDCTSLTSITIPEGVTSIGNNAFWRCSSLTTITIPDSITTIGSSAFGYCSLLTSITIPDSVSVIGLAAFSGCKSLTTVNFLGDAPRVSDFPFSINEPTTIYRKADAKGWGPTFGRKPVKIITEKP